MKTLLGIILSMGLVTSSQAIEPATTYLFYTALGSVTYIAGDQNAKPIDARLFKTVKVKAKYGNYMMENTVFETENK